ncbi:uncharacterized protein MONBRDRAFT_10178 [Monosiga brevicollis MX1]|uniref:PDZ domain-containing protein n=1 Tax=Monosiga brevicollis TaxID=81824 RepID=A9V5F9_MONBE|nr:uncharacterized protein MONBRDRAFT_10178 [Monosiga brevicollis MX1]EDQ87364.1 predicted protein [Monosiga brevicollis MX1]|eukprot:XP_001747977.1 hypothetical protein [Monosiga brevicollis MX1]
MPRAYDAGMPGMAWSSPGPGRGVGTTSTARSSSKSPLSSINGDPREVASPKGGRTSPRAPRRATVFLEATPTSTPACLEVKQLDRTHANTLSGRTTPNEPLHGSFEDSFGLEMMTPLANSRASPARRQPAPTWRVLCAQSNTPEECSPPAERTDAVVIYSAEPSPLCPQSSTAGRGQQQSAAPPGRLLQTRSEPDLLPSRIRGSDDRAASTARNRLRRAHAAHVEASPAMPKEDGRTLQPARPARVVKSASLPNLSLPRRIVSAPQPSTPTASKLTSSADHTENASRSHLDTLASSFAQYLQTFHITVHMEQRGLGLQLGSVNSNDMGLVVQHVSPTSPSAHLLRPGDVLLKINGRDVQHLSTKEAKHVIVEEIVQDANVMQLDILRFMVPFHTSPIQRGNPVPAKVPVRGVPQRPDLPRTERPITPHAIDQVTQPPPVLEDDPQPAASCESVSTTVGEPQNVECEAVTEPKPRVVSLPNVESPIRTATETADLPSIAIMEATASFHSLEDSGSFDSLTALGRAALDLSPAGDRTLSTIHESEVEDSSLISSTSILDISVRACLEAAQNRYREQCAPSTGALRAGTRHLEQHDTSQESDQGSVVTLPGPRCEAHATAASSPNKTPTPTPRHGAGAVKAPRHRNRRPLQRFGEFPVCDMDTLLEATQEEATLLVAALQDDTATDEQLPEVASLISRSSVDTEASAGRYADMLQAFDNFVTERHSAPQLTHSSLSAGLSPISLRSLVAMGGDEASRLGTRRNPDPLIISAMLSLPPSARSLADLAIGVQQSYEGGLVVSPAASQAPRCALRAHDRIVEVSQCKVPGRWTPVYRSLRSRGCVVPQVNGLSLLNLNFSQALEVLQRALARPDEVLVAVWRSSNGYAVPSGR